MESFCNEIRPIEEVCYLEHRYNDQAVPIAQKHNLLGSEMVGFGGLDDVRFRNFVRPGERLVLMAILERIRHGAMIVSRFQGFVDQSLVVAGKIRGIPLPIDAIRR